MTCSCSQVLSWNSTQSSPSESQMVALLFQQLATSGTWVHDKRESIVMHISEPVLVYSLVLLGEVIKQNSPFPKLLCSCHFDANKVRPMRRLQTDLRMWLLGRHWPQQLLAPVADTHDLDIRHLSEAALGARWPGSGSSGNLLLLPGFRWQLQEWSLPGGPVPSGSASPEEYSLEPAPSALPRILEALTPLRTYSLC